MAEIGFYHLTRTGPDQALPALLGRTLAAGKRAVVMLATEERVAALDDALWLCETPDWLPHGSSSVGDAELQPIWLTTQEGAPNRATYLFLLDGTEQADMTKYERVFVLFNGTDDGEVAAARLAWTSLRKAGHEMVYWQQGPKGWVRNN